MKIFDLIFSLLLIVGGLNWGAIGLTGTDLVVEFFGQGTPLTTLIYDLVGFSALYSLFMWKSMHNRWACR